MKEITKNDFETEVLLSKVPVLVDFYAPWCGPCRTLSPILEELSNQSSDYKIVKVNTDDEPALASEYNVNSLPTMIVFKNGRQSEFFVGLKKQEQILNALMD